MSVLSFIPWINWTVSCSHSLRAAGGTALPCTGWCHGLQGAARRGLPAAQSAAAAGTFAPCEVRVGSCWAASCICRVTTQSSKGSMQQAPQCSARPCWIVPTGGHSRRLCTAKLGKTFHGQCTFRMPTGRLTHLKTSLRLLQAWIFAALDDEAQAAKFYTLAALYSLPAVRSALELRLDGFTIFSIVACAVHVQVRGWAAFCTMHALVLCR